MSEMLDQLSRDHDRLLPIVKAHFVGEQGAVQSTVIVEQERSSGVLTDAGALTPAYDPQVLATIYENSSALRPNVDAYITNIDSFGHCFVPTIDTTAVDADDKIRDAIRFERIRGKLDPQNATKADVLLAADEPTAAEVAQRKKLLGLEIRAEHARLKTFFENCTYDMPFSGPEGLRGLTRQDIEVIGSGYWEVLRNDLQEVCQFNFIPGVSVRLMPMDEKATSVEIERRVSILSTEKLEVFKRFRRYVQVSMGMDANVLVYFKEFGDPRVLSSKTGRYYATLDEMKADQEEEGARPATEILAFKISSSRSPYGVPRWIGALLAVMGTRQSEEVNFLYFENRSVPPMAILVSGGRLNDNTIARLEDYIKNEIRGKRNFHKIMILEAESQDATMGIGESSRMRIELKPLTDAQQKDGLFQAYDERNADKVGQSFRLPRILRGDVRDFNRSTAESSIDFAEIQVFGPIRQQFDWMINKMIFPAIGVKHHDFKSNAPTVRDPEALSRMVALLVSSNVLTPAEARELSQDVFNRSFDNRTETWTQQPISVTLAQMPIDAAKEAQQVSASSDPLKTANAAGVMSVPNAGATQRSAGVPQKPKTTPPDRTKPKPKSDNKIRAQAKAIMKMSEQLRLASESDEEVTDTLVEAAADDGPVIIKVPDAEFSSWFKKPD